MKNRLFTIILRFHLISILGKYITLLPSNVKTHNIQTLMIFTQFDEMINSNFWTRKEYAMPFLILIATVWKCVHRKTNIRCYLYFYDAIVWVVTATLWPSPCIFFVKTLPYCLINIVYHVKLKIPSPIFSTHNTTKKKTSCRK